ncbi:MAG: carboxy terminal-processing peptidase [Flavobacteriaceae bacterium]|nr:carboxy terminal-processing peptidase [Flavobacteriaceae bacterium]
MQKIFRFMKRNYKIIIPIVLLIGLLFGSKVFSQNNLEKDKILVALIRDALTNAHYNPKKMDDDFSEKVFENYIEALDPTKKFFTSKDIKLFANYKKEIDDQIKTEDLTFFHIVTNRFLERLNETENFYAKTLTAPFDYEKNETYNLDYEKVAYPKNNKARIEKWRKQLKLNVLGRLYDKIEDENKTKKDSVDYVVKTMYVLEKEAREKTAENMSDYYKRMEDLTQEDWFSLYINSITATFDPHTTYFSPKTKKKFDISMSGKLEGIGARLQKKGDYTKVAELISGGPAWRKGELEVGDLILKVAQADAEPIDIVGMRLDDAIEYIKGKKGTEVRLTLKKIDGTTQVISIIRDVVELEETFAKSSIVEFNNKTFGVINLPQFYIDFSEKSFRNSATDIEKEIEELKKENIEGILIDLRNNGGGSLKTAIEIAGLFIDKGPIVQVKYKDAKPRIDRDRNEKIQWGGSLVVLVNELSASASEIFAAAMQDYKRAIIIGSNQTFGKGTVQNVLGLNNFFRYKKDLGALKMTIQKFYRIDGGSTQLKGVVSDIAIPNRFTYMVIGERDEKNPLKWDKIKPAKYKALDFYENFDDVVQNSKTRIIDNLHFNLINENAKWLKKTSEDKVAYLNYKKFKTDIDNHNKEAEKFKKLKDYKNDLKFKSPLYELSLMNKDSVLAEKRNTWHKNLSKDIYIEEALRVLSELKVKNSIIVKG